MTATEYKTTKSTLRKVLRMHRIRMAEVQALLLKLDESPNRPKNAPEWPLRLVYGGLR